MKNILNLLKVVFAPRSKNTLNLGANEDTRPTISKIDDLYVRDIVTTPAPVVWVPLDISKLPDWPILDQGFASACVAFSKAIMDTMIYFARTGVMVVFSPKWIYNWRKNKSIGDGTGMIGVDAFDIDSNYGVVPEDLMPSQGLSEAQINAFTPQPWLVEIGKALRTSTKRIMIPIGDIDTLASVLQVTNKPVMVWFNFSYSEWIGIPEVISNIVPNLKHSVTVPSRKNDTDMNFGMYNGKKAIVIQDSWGLKATPYKGKRIITEDFFRARNIFMAYSMTFRFDEASDSTKPSYDGVSVVSLQKCLRYEGCFPVNVAFIESFGPITRNSIAQFQANYKLPATGLLDDATKQLLKSLYP